MFAFNLLILKTLISRKKYRKGGPLQKKNQKIFFFLKSTKTYFFLSGLTKKF
jgi:hypothetical protein